MSIVSVEAIQNISLSMLPIDWDSVAPEKIEELLQVLEPTQESYDAIALERAQALEEMKKHRAVADSSNGETND
jgi:hypothetical protein